MIRARLIRASLICVSAMLGACVVPDIVAELVEDEAPKCAGDCPCMGGECQQSCITDDSVDCEFTCAPGAVCEQVCDSPEGCSSECTDAARCQLDCLASGDCHMTCTNTDCDTQCLSGCSSYCEGSGCNMYCLEGGCSLHCRDAEYCHIMMCPFGCSLICDNVIDCQNDCADPTSCSTSIK